MAVVSSCREMWVKSRNERNLAFSCQRVKAGTLEGLPVSNRRKVGMTSSPHGPYGQGYTRTTMAGTKGSDVARQRNPEKPVSVRIGVWNRSMKLESLVIVDQHATGEYVPGALYTPPSNTGVGGSRSSRAKPVREAGCQGMAWDWVEILPGAPRGTWGWFTPFGGVFHKKVLRTVTFGDRRGQ